jgi:hypothetical protein
MNRRSLHNNVLPLLFYRSSGLLTYCNKISITKIAGNRAPVALSSGLRVSCRTCVAGCAT